MALYAHIVNGAVVEFFTPPTGFTIGDCFNPSLIWIAVPADLPDVAAGWSYADGVFSPPVATAPSLKEQAAGMFAEGIILSSTSNPDLNATYQVDLATQSHIQAELWSILLNNKFADGTDTLAWPDRAGNIHTFSSTDQFKAFATAIGSFVAALAKVQNETLTTLPSTSLTIP